MSLAAILAAERVRAFRVVQQRGQEFSGRVIPSRYGAFARAQWAGASSSNDIPSELAPLVRKGTELLVPLLDLAARRAWSGPSLDAAAAAAVGADDATWRALLGDGDAEAWPRARLEQLALEAFALVLDEQRTPPPYLLQTTEGGFSGPANEAEAPVHWALEERHALLPLVDRVLAYDDKDDCEHNCVLGSPPPPTVGNLGVGECLWCVALTRLEPGDTLRAPDPWQADRSTPRRTTSSDRALAP